MTYKRTEQETIDEDVGLIIYRTPISPCWYLQYQDRVPRPATALAARQEQGTGVHLGEEGGCQALARSVRARTG